MATVSEFLKSSPHLERNAGDVHSTDVCLEATIIGITESTVDFLHLSKRFSVNREYVTDISGEAGSPSVRLSIQPSAKVSWIESVSAHDLISGVPFPFQRSSVAPRAPEQSPLVSNWIATHGYAPNMRDGRVVLFSSVPCESVSGGVYDDSKSDSYD